MAAYYQEIQQLNHCLSVNINTAITEMTMKSPQCQIKIKKMKQGGTYEQENVYGAFLRKHR